MEHAYSRNLTEPAEKVGATNQELTGFAKRDFLGVDIGTGLWDQWTALEKNRYGTMEVRRTGDPAPRPAPYQDRSWQTVLSESAVVAVEVDMARYYDITQTWSEPAIEESRAIARQDVETWIANWRNSEFTHAGTVYDANQDQELRLSFTDTGARIDPTTFTASWYAKDGTKVTFSNQTTWNDFVRSALNHVNTGTASAETALAAIEQAANTTALSRCWKK